MFLRRESEQPRRSRAQLEAELLPEKDSIANLLLLPEKGDGGKEGMQGAFQEAERVLADTSHSEDGAEGIALGVIERVRLEAVPESDGKGLVPKLYPLAKHLLTLPQGEALKLPRMRRIDHSAFRYAANWAFGHRVKLHVRTAGDYSYWWREM